jgi:uncharacterized protein YegL
MNEPAELSAIEFAENPEPRCPCVILVDTSGSMNGAPIAALNQGLLAFREDLVKDSLASRRVEVAVVTFDDVVQVVQEFVTTDQFQPPTLGTGGLTHMGSGILTALDLVQNRKALYRSNGIAYYRPWVFMITDGAPTGEPSNRIQEAARRVKDDEANKRVSFFAVGVEGANMAQLATIAVRQPLKLNGLNFVEMFLWLSVSTQAISHSKLDEQVPLSPPGWGSTA